MDDFILKTRVFPIEKIVVVQNGFGLPSRTYTFKLSIPNGSANTEKALVGALLAGGYWTMECEKPGNVAISSGQWEYDLAVFGDKDGDHGFGRYRNVWTSDSVQPGIPRILKNVIEYVMKNGELSQ